MNNPFTPNFGQVPAYLAGRSFLINEITRALDNGLGDPNLASIIVGARGTGKTALLSYLAGEAGQRGWLVVNTACTKGLLEDIYQQTMLAASQVHDSPSKKTLKGVTFGSIVGLEWDNESELELNWRMRMSNILDSLAQQDTGLLITVDEVDPNSEEMMLLATVYQLFVREERKIALFMAGLPSNVSNLVRGKSVSFLRRAGRFDLERIPDHEVEMAFIRTVESGGKTIDKDALAAAVKASAGFPYMIQLVGFRSWEEAGTNKKISLQAVEQGIELATKDMQARVLQATLNELSKGDLEFLQAMMPDEKKSATAELASRLGKSEAYVARYRSRLIERGVIEFAGRGYVAFALPGIDAYVPIYLDS